jgi:hypothetical protein
VTTVRKIDISALTTVVLLIAAGSAFAAGESDSLQGNAANKSTGSVAPKTPVKQIVFEEQKIEGKIRRPQLVLIKADQRPEFTPMIMQSIGQTKSISILIDENIIGSNVNNAPFSFEGTKVRYTTP